MERRASSPVQSLRRDSRPRLSRPSAARQASVVTQFWIRCRIPSAVGVPNHTPNHVPKSKKNAVYGLDSSLKTSIFYAKINQALVLAK